MEDTKEEIKEENKEEKEEKVSEKEETKKKSKALPIILVVIVLILVGLYLVGRTASRFIANRVLSGITGQNVQVDSSGDKVTVETEEGQVSFEAGGSLPAGFPSDFPVYSGAKVVSSFTAQGEQDSGMSVVWESSDSQASVADFYKKQLPAAGYTVSSTFEATNSLTISFKKGETEGFMGVTSGEGGKTTISVTVGVQ